MRFTCSSATVRTFVAAVLLAAGVVGQNPLSAHAANGAPGAPTDLTALEGSDGIRLSWHAPADDGGLTGYQLQRVATPYSEDPGSTYAPFADLILLPAVTTSYVDVPVGGYYWSYRVLALGPGGSTPSDFVETRLGYPANTGTTYNQVTIDGLAGTGAAGGVFIDSGTGGTVTASRIDEHSFRLVATPAVDAPDERTFSFVIGSIGWGHRLDQRKYTTTPSDTSDDRATVFRIENAPECADRPGSLQVDEAQFLMDGTPLNFAATYSFCDAIEGHIRYAASTPIGTAMTVDHPALSFDGLNAQTVTFTNPATQPQNHGGPSVVDTSGSATQTYTVTGDTCGNSPLAPGASCAITVAPTAADPPPARLVWQDSTPLGRREIDLSSGTAPPVPTIVRVEPTLRGVAIAWNRFDSASPITGYRVYRGATPSSLSLLTTVAGNGPGLYVDRTPTAGTTYFYALTATSAVGEGPRTATSSAAPATTGSLTATNRWSGTADSDIAVLTDGGIAERLTAGHDNTDPAIARSGTTYAYSSDREAAAGDRSIWVAGLGAAPQRLTSLSGATDTEPAFSPDGTTIAFTRRTGGTTSLWTVPTAGGTAKQVPGTTDDSHPTWAPSGRLLAAAHRDAGRSAIVETNLNGSFRRTLTPSDPNVDFLAPAWGPDGRYVALILRDATRSMVAISDTGPSGNYPNLASPYGIRVRSVRWGPAGIVFEGRSTQYSSYYALQGATVWKRSGSGQDAAPVVGSDAAGYASPAPAGTWPAHIAYAPPSPPELRDNTTGDGTVGLNFVLPQAGYTNCYQCAAWAIIRRSEAGGQPPKTVNDGVLVYEGPGPHATVTGLTNLRQYGFSFFAVSTVGDVGGPATNFASAAPTPMMNSTATVLGNLSGNGPNFTVSWGGKPLPKEGFDYQVQMGTRAFDAKKKTFAAAPTFKTFYENGTATSKVVTAKPGTTYYFRVRIAAWTSQQTAWSPVVAFTVPYDDRAFSAKGSWTALTKQKGRFLATLRESSAKGATLTMKAPGSAFALFADRCPTCGKVQIFVDGKLITTIDTYAKKSTPRSQVWAGSLGQPGPHTITVKVVGTGKKRLVRIDGFAAAP